MGLEPTTFCVQSRRSRQLSYVPGAPIVPGPRTHAGSQSPPSLLDVRRPDGEAWASASASRSTALTSSGVPDGHRHRDERPGDARLAGQAGPERALAGLDLHPRPAPPPHQPEHAEADQHGDNAEAQACPLDASTLTIGPADNTVSRRLRRA